ncbi:membrane-spanning 4-domains subfamily A member 8-like [Pipistrellus kuhlii]|uniref:membrane-spanning 4-domains subfamily A member 8-like n=1 Tax=Pipistrellus kuhlii TaxID=59472 RepID=UPI00174F1530|nr:membrane-spanning 4-domains subfamily A member 8-like [Pipistrellus kuhlii]
MNSMTSTDSKANTVFVAAPHNGHPVIPGNMSQVPQYPLNQPQVYIISGNPPGLEPPVYTQFDQRSFKAGKVLGAMQILIGLIHIVLGSILGTIISLSFLGCYPFLGGILFIIAGSLSEASYRKPRSSSLVPGIITTALLIIFSFLEFSIAGMAIHFGSQLRQAQKRGSFQTVYANPGLVNSPPYHVNVAQASG